MAQRSRGYHHGAMTHESPAAELRGDRSIQARRLRRRAADRVIGGVASGIGDYLNVDPVLVRAAFAGLLIFGGAGLVLYVVAWLLIPAQGETDSIAEAAIRRLARRTGRFGTALLVLGAIVVASPWLTGYGGAFYIQAEVFWAFAIVLVGAVLLLGRQGRIGESSAGGPVGSTSSDLETAARALPRSRPVERSPLGWYVVAATSLVMGALAIADNVAAVEVTLGQYFGSGLLVLGVGLVIAAWWGRARPLILLGFAVLPLAVTAAFISVPLRGGTGDHEYRPQSLGELQPEYRLVGGRIWLDLTHLQPSPEPISITASVGIGNFNVVIPDGARVQILGRVDGGQLSLLGGYLAGTGLVDRVERPGTAGGLSLILTLEAGIGSVWVEQTPVEGS